MPITRKSKREIALMRAAGQVVARVLAELKVAAAPGVTTRELDDLAREAFARHHAIAAFLDYDGFPDSICTSVNDVVVHGIPSHRKLRSGDVLSLDVGAIIEGYYGDAALTIPIGDVTPEALKLIEATEMAFWKGVARARAGNHVGDISHAIGEFVEEQGYGSVWEFGGHGVGLDMHEEPSIPNQGPAGAGPLLKPGMTIAIEPMLTLGSSDVEVLDDDWAIVTADGSIAAHYEHTVLITDGEPELLTMLRSDVV